MICPKCGSENTVKNGHTHNKKQKFACKNCSRQFVENPTKKIISDTIKALIDKMLLERISLAGISRVTGVSLTWLYNYVKKKYAKTPRKLKVVKKKKGKLIVQMDELWSFVDNKGNKQWVWIAIDAETREVIGLYIGDRSRKSAQALMGFSTSSL